MSNGACYRHFNTEEYSWPNSVNGSRAIESVIPLSSFSLYLSAEFVVRFRRRRRSIISRRRVRAFGGRLTATISSFLLTRSTDDSDGNIVQREADTVCAVVKRRSSACRRWGGIPGILRWRRRCCAGRHVRSFRTCFRVLVYALQHLLHVTLRCVNGRTCYRPT